MPKYVDNLISFIDRQRTLFGHTASEGGSDVPPEPQEGWVIDGVTYLHRSVIDLSALEMGDQSQATTGKWYSPVDGSLFTLSTPHESAYITHYDAEMEGQHIYANQLTLGHDSNGDYIDIFLSTNYGEGQIPAFEPKAFTPVSQDDILTEDSILLPQCSNYYAEVSDDGRTLTTYYNLREEPYPILVADSSHHYQEPVEYYHKRHFDLQALIDEFSQSASERVGYDAITGEIVELNGSEIPVRPTIILERPNLQWEQGSPIAVVLAHNYTGNYQKLYLAGNLSSEEAHSAYQVYSYQIGSYELLPDVVVGTLPEATEPYQVALSECTAFMTLLNYGHDVLFVDNYVIPNCIDIYYTLKSDTGSEQVEQQPDPNVEI